MINNDAGICIASTGLQNKMMWDVCVCVCVCVWGGGSQAVLYGCVKVLTEVSLEGAE